jgi:hypothetical protein
VHFFYTKDFRLLGILSLNFNPFARQICDRFVYILVSR